jgi:hypothetical protein
MFYIRLFLWGLVAAMTLQGWLHADEYGTAATLVGGVTMTMSVWSESFIASMKGFLSSGPKVIGLPRALVSAALQESGRHPIIKTLPRLKITLEGHQKVWNAFRDAHVSWSLSHMDLIGGLHTEAAELWNFWPSQQNATAVLLNATRKSRCLMRSSTRSCTAIEDTIQSLSLRLEKENAAEKAWASVLGFHDSTSWQKAETWWLATQESIGSVEYNDHIETAITLLSPGQVAVVESRAASFALFQTALRALHNVTEVTDERIELMLRSIQTMPAPLNPWIHRLLASLLEGDVWAAAMEHVRARESRVRELMIAAGVQELWATHERILAASLKAIGGNHKLAEDWFGEMASYAWWLPDEVPGIVRRCIGQEGGDCSRLGPTEIQALLVQHREQIRILEDWTRRIFIGMWNAMPVIGLLFALELIVLILPQKRVLHVWEERPQPQLQLQSQLLKNS